MKVVLYNGAAWCQTIILYDGRAILLPADTELLKRVTTTKRRHKENTSKTQRPQNDCKEMQDVMTLTVVWQGALCKQGPAASYSMCT